MKTARPDHRQDCTLSRQQEQPITDGMLHPRYNNFGYMWEKRGINIDSAGESCTTYTFGVILVMPAAKQITRKKKKKKRYKFGITKCHVIPRAWQVQILSLSGTLGKPLVWSAEHCFFGIDAICFAYYIWVAELIFHIDSTEGITGYHFLSSSANTRELIMSWKILGGPTEVGQCFWKSC